MTCQGGTQARKTYLSDSDLIIANQYTFALEFGLDTLRLQDLFEFSESNIAYKYRGLPLSRSVRDCHVK